MSGINYAGDPVSPQRETEVQRQLTTLQKQQAELHEAVCELESRIGAVLRPPMPQPTEVGKLAQEPPSAPVAVTLYEMASRMNNTIANVRDMLRRVEA